MWNTKPHMHKEKKNAERDIALDKIVNLISERTDSCLALVAKK